MTTAEDGSVTLTGGSINSYGAFFNGVLATDGATVTMKDVTMEFIGDGANDFNGEGAAVYSYGSDTVVTLDSVYIHTAGVIRTAAAVKDGQLYIKNSVIYAEESQDTDAEYEALVVPMMKRTPFALGLEGVVRATNVLGAGEGIYSDSLVVCTGWGVLSTDSGQSGTEALQVTNVTAGIGTLVILEGDYDASEYTKVMTVNGVTYGYTLEGSGYVAYADAGVIDYFEGVDFYGGDYVQIMASSNSSAYYTNSTLTSARIGVMTQQNNGGTISIVNSTLNVVDTGIQIKSGAANIGYTNVILDNTTVNITGNNAWSGALIELVESDDAGNPGNTTYTISDTGDTATTADSAGTITDSNATLANGSYTGDIYNNIYNYTQALNVTLDNADLTGTVSSSYSYHAYEDGTRIENGTVLTAATTGDYRVDEASSDYVYIGSQVNVVSPMVNNPVNLTIYAKSTWTVGEVNYLNNLEVDSTSSLMGTGTVYASTFTINGEKQDDGTYTYGDVTVVVSYVEVGGETEDNGVLVNSQDYSGNAFIIQALDQDGNSATEYIDFDYQIFAEVGFNVSLKDEYADSATISIEYANGAYASDGSTLENDFDYYFMINPAEDGSAAVVTIRVTLDSGENL